FAGQVIGGAALGHVRTSGGIFERHFRCELVVLADKQGWQLPNAGHVQAFVKSTIVHRAVAEESDADPSVLKEFEAVTGAGGLENARSNDAARTHEADFRSEQVHAAAAAMRAASLPAVQLREQLPW